MGQLNGAVIHAASSLQKGYRLNPGPETFMCKLCMFFSVSWVLPGFSHFLPQSKNMHVRPTDNLISLCVRVSLHVNGCVSLVVFQLATCPWCHIAFGL